MLHFKKLIVILPLLLIFKANAYLLQPTVYGSLCYSSSMDFDEFRYEEQIAHCKRSVSSARKDRICLRDGILVRTADFTVDHIIPLSIGGSNRDDNLWCQHKSLNVTRQEYKTYLRLRSGKITQVPAIAYILSLKFKKLTLDK